MIDPVKPRRIRAVFVARDWSIHDTQNLRDPPFRSMRFAELPEFPAPRWADDGAFPDEIVEIRYRDFDLVKVGQFFGREAVYRES